MLLAGGMLAGVLGCHDVPVDPLTSTVVPPADDPTGAGRSRHRQATCAATLQHGRFPGRIDSATVDASRGLSITFERGGDPARPIAAALDFVARFPWPDTSRIPEAGFGTRGIRQILLRVPRAAFQYGPDGRATSIVVLDGSPLDGAGLEVVYHPRGATHPRTLTTGEQRPRGTNSGEFRIESFDSSSRIIRATLRAKFYSEDGSPMRDVTIDRLAILIEF